MRCLAAIFVLLLVTAAAAAAFLWAGGFDISARVPHSDITLEAIETVRNWSIAAHSRDVNIPPLGDPKLSASGFSEYHETCRLCHGAPGLPASVFAQGLYPAPANLRSPSVQNELKDNQLYWVVENGLKMTGMPAFGDSNDSKTILGIVAFVRRLPEMSSEDYQTLMNASGGERAREHNEGENG